MSQNTMSCVLGAILAFQGLASAESISAEDSPGVTDLGQTVVSDRGSSHSQVRILDSGEVLSQDRLERRRGLTLAETLRDQPGVAVRSMGPAPARPVLHGLSGEHVLVTEDGGRTADLSATSPDHAVALEPLTIESVALLQGPRMLVQSSALAGGVVDVNRGDIPQVRDDWSGTVRLQAESGQPGYAGSVVAVSPGSLMSVRGEATWRQAGDAWTPDGRIHNTDLQTNGAALGANAQLGKWSAGASGRLYQSEYGIPGGFVGAHPHGVDIRMERQNADGRLTWRSVGDSLGVAVRHSWYHHTEYESNGSVGAEFVARQDGVRMDHWIQRIGPFLDVSSGVEVLRRKMEFGGYVFTTPTTEYDSWAWVVGALHPGIRGAEWSLGARTGLVQMDGAPDRSFPVLAASYSWLQRVAPGQFVNLEFHRAARAPTIEELYNQGPHLAAYTYEVGDTALDGESGYGGELSWRLSRGDWSARTTLYGTWFDSYLAPRATGDTNWSQLLPIYAVSQGSALLTGGDARLEYAPERGFGMESALSLVRGYWMNSWSDMPQIPPPRWNLELSWRLRQWRYWLRSEAALRQVRVDRYESPTDGYVIVGSGVQWTPQGWMGRHTVILSVDNLTNQEYRNHLSRLRSVMPEQGRSWKANWRLAF